MIARLTAKQINFDELLKNFDSSTHPAIRELATKDIEAIVLLSVLQMDSNQFGHTQALAVGPNNSWTLDHVLDTPSFRTGDVPSRFHYPVSYWRKS